MDFFGDVFGRSASLIEGLNRVVGDSLSAQEWFPTSKSEEAPVKLPWQASSVEERAYERQLREAVLLISQSPQIFLQDASEDANDLPADNFASAGAVLEADDGLRQLRFRLVPKYCSEEQFWDRYFAAVEKVKQHVKAEQMWGDFDMLDEDDNAAHEPPAAQVELPCSRQPTNATDTMAQMVLPGQSCNSAQALSCSAKGKQSPGPRAAPVRIQLKQPLGLEPAAERMAMSGDLGSQASSITEALLMSPRSISSTTTKASPATAPPLGPATHTSQHSAPSPFPLSPLSPGSSRSAANSAHASAEPSKEEADTRGTQSHDARNAAYGRKATDRLGPELMQSVAVTVAASEGAVAGKLAVGKKAEANGANGFGVPSEGDSAPLHVPFGAVALQQLANAALTSKKVTRMEQLMGHGGAGNTILGDRAATAAWKLFEPMQYGMHNPADAPVTSPHGLAGRIATAMADMSGCAEMAMLWSEVMQEVEAHWASGRSLPHATLPICADGAHFTLHNCFATMNADLAYRQRRAPAFLEAGPGIEGQGDHALDALKGLLPRTVFQQLFAVKAQMSLSAAAAVACSAADNDVLLSGVREVQQLVNAELSQPLVSKHQLTRLCQVFKKLEVMFQVAVEQNNLRQQTQQQAAWIATASQQDMQACIPGSSCSADEDPTWSDLDYESWTLL